MVAKVRAIEAKRDAGMVESAGRAPTVGDWLDHWLDNIASRKVRARTLESYRSTVRLHLRPGVGHQRLDRLQPEHLERLYAALADKGLSPASILRAHRVLSRALKVASQRGKVARNVATLVDPPVVKRPETAMPLTAQEVRRVMASAQAHRNAARWTVAMAVGLRQSEALALRWADVDLEQGTLTVRRGVHRVRGKGLVYEEPKADRSRRTLALPGPLVEALRVHRAAQLEDRVAAGGEWVDLDLVFAQPNGKAIERKSDWRAWKAPLQEAGVRDVRLHDGRHTAATLLLSEGVHPRVVMEVLGHAQMRTTTDTYSHVMPALGRDAADRVGRALWDGPDPRFAVARGDHDRVTDMDLVLRALAERGAWHGSDEGDVELIRVEIRRPARKAGIKVRTVVDGLGRPHACTPDGWPAHEPWRGAVIHAHESGAMGGVVAQALDGLLRNDDAG